MLLFNSCKHNEYKINKLIKIFHISDYTDILNKKKMHTEFKNDEHNYIFTINDWEFNSYFTKPISRTLLDCNIEIIVVYSNNMLIFEEKPHGIKLFFEKRNVFIYTGTRSKIKNLNILHQGSYSNFKLLNSYWYSALYSYSILSD